MQGSLCTPLHVYCCDRVHSGTGHSGVALVVENLEPCCSRHLSDGDLLGLDELYICILLQTAHATHRGAHPPADD